MQFRYLITLIYKSQNDIYIVSKLFLKNIILCIGMQQSTTIIIM
jgi:hypothetical protein